MSLPGNGPLQHALGLAELGFLVFPVHSVRDGKCTCRDPDNCKHKGKHPRTRHGLKDGTKDPRLIHRRWKQNPNSNVAIATGAESGVIVIDIDPRHGGDKTFEGLLNDLGSLPATVVATTGGGGRHYVFAHPGGFVKNLQGIAPGIDIKGDGGYIVVAPSNHESGRRYAWQRSFDPWTVKPAPLPVLWLEWLRSNRAFWAPPRNDHRVSRSATNIRDAIAQMPFAREAVAVANSKSLRDGSNNHQKKTDGERYREIQNSRQRDKEAIHGFCGGDAPAKSLPVSSLNELTTDEKQAVQRAIKRNLPKAPGERNQKGLFEFARAIAGMPRLCDAGDDVLRPIVEAYYKAAAPRTSGTHDIEDYWDEFRYCLPLVRFPGEFNMLEIMEAVAAGPPHPACAAKGCSERRRVLLLGLCAELQKRHGDGRFFLSCSKAAELLTKVGHPTEAMQVHRMLHRFQRNGLLKIAQKGDRHNATRWWFLWKPPAA